MRVSGAQGGRAWREAMQNQGRCEGDDEGEWDTGAQQRCREVRGKDKAVHSEASTRGLRSSGHEVLASVKDA